MRFSYLQENSEECQFRMFYLLKSVKVNCLTEVVISLFVALFMKLFKKKCLPRHQKLIVRL